MSTRKAVGKDENDTVSNQNENIVCDYQSNLCDYQSKEESDRHPPHSQFERAAAVLIEAERGKEAAYAIFWELLIIFDYIADDHSAPHAIWIKFARLVSSIPMAYEKKDELRMILRS